MVVKSPTKAQQALIDAAVAAALAEAKKSLVVAASKPDLIENLRKTWRNSAEHKAAQVKLFLSTVFGIVALQVISDVAAGKTPFTTVHDMRSLWYYLAPFVLVAWRQRHPALTAEQVDSANGVTIVPSQVGVPVVEADLPDDATVEVTDPVARIENAVDNAGAEGDAAP